VLLFLRVSRRKRRSRRCSVEFARGAEVARSVRASGSPPPPSPQLVLSYREVSWGSYTRRRPRGECRAEPENGQLSTAHRKILAPTNCHILIPAFFGG